MSEVNFKQKSVVDSPKRSCKEIIDLFNQYGFKDDLGHDLVNCQDFIELVELSVLSSDFPPIPEDIHVAPIKNESEQRDKLLSYFCNIFFCPKKGEGGIVLGLDKPFEHILAQEEVVLLAQIDGYAIILLEEYEILTPSYLDPLSPADVPIGDS